jgi:4-amino-4-deoxy-L-arabinose transferase-like glycosyltransferase
MYARIISDIFASIGVFFLYLIGKKLFSSKVATLAAFFYAVIPYNIYYGRVIMPDPTFICFSIISFYLLLLMVEKPNFVRGILFSLAFATAMLVKPYAVFLFIPFIYWVIANHGWSAFKKPMFYLAPILSVIPLLLWRHHASLHPEGIFYTSWLLNKYNIRFTGAFFRWLIFDRMNRLIFATGGFVLFFFGLTHSIRSKKGWLMVFWLISVLAYFTVFAAGNVQHDYYQLPLMPVGALLVSLGFFEIINSGKNIFQKIVLGGIASVLIILSLAFGWYEVRGFFNINDWNMIEAGKRIDEITPKDAKVIAPYQTNPAFLYQTNRHGWTMGYDIEKKIAEGATYYVSTSYDDEARQLEKQYTLIEKNDKYIIINLVEKTK